MGTPVNTATENNQTVELSQVVSETVAKVKRDDEGKLVFPEDISKTPFLKEAVIAEVRRRDTLASYTKGQQLQKALEAENAALKSLTTEKVVLSSEQNEELDELKYENPDEWYKKKLQFENEALQKVNEKVNEVTSKAKTSASSEFELSRRAEVLSAFNDSAKIKITDDVIANDVPPRITKKLESGSITFEQFLKDVEEYITADKVVKNEEVLNQPNISTKSGGDKPSEEKAEKSLNEQYKSTRF